MNNKKNNRKRTMNSNNLRFFAASLAFLALSGCIPAAIGAGAVGANFATQDRTTGNAVDDISLKTKVKKKFFDKNYDDLYSNVDVDVVERRVLLTGSVQRPETVIDAVNLAWQVPGVHEVVNEIQVNDKSSLKDSARDAWISTQIHSRLLFTKGISSSNYTIEVVNGTVYLFGLARTETESQQVASIAARTQYVKNVVSHVVVEGDPRRDPLKG